METAKHLLSAAGQKLRLPQVRFRVRRPAIGGLLALAWALLSFRPCTAQSLENRIAAAAKRFADDPQNTHATVSLTVLNARTGAVVYAREPETGVAPASCQKTITAATALFLLGGDFHFTTTLGISGTHSDHALLGDLIVRGGGDPTLGSWRYSSATREVLLERWVDAVRKAGIRRIEGRVLGDARVFDSQMPPDGWIWQDIGNYYGAGPSGLTWHENQYDLLLRPGKRAGAPVAIASTDPPVSLHFVNELLTGEAGSGDRTYLYAAPYGSLVFVRGTAPEDRPDFRVSGAMPDPALWCAQDLRNALMQAGIAVTGKAATMGALERDSKPVPAIAQTLDRYGSPALDSVLYWFLKRSINLYGEQLIKTIALKAAVRACTDSGVAVEKRFWEAKGIDPDALHIVDGSGLSPGNRVTTGAMARILYIASRQPWFAVYRNCLPVIHGIVMKSGHINGVCSYAGYLASGDGTPLVFSFIVNNYNGETPDIQQKMFKTLDEIKR